MADKISDEKKKNTAGLPESTAEFRGKSRAAGARKDDRTAEHYLSGMTGIKYQDYVLEIKDLHTGFRSSITGKYSEVLYGIDIHAERGKILGIVGESGSGKSITMLSVMRLLGNNAEMQGEILLNGENLLEYTEEQMRDVRGGRISMVFQDPMTALNPVYTIGNQIMEMIRRHRKDIPDAAAYAAELLELVGISDGRRRLKQYPHELSGGMRQRVVIAMALASDPEILIADEPTTALDVTVQAQIIDLIKEITKKKNMTTIIITHDLGIVARICDNVVVLYGGRICERGTVREIFKDPRHEYTKGLIAAVPGAGAKKRLVPIEGTPVNRSTMPKGCVFCPRCQKAMEICLTEHPEKAVFSDTHEAYCWVNSLPEGFVPEESGREESGTEEFITERSGLQESVPEESVQERGTSETDGTGNNEPADGSIFLEKEGTKHDR